MASSSATAPSPVVRVEPLGFPYATADPFLFAVYHDDKYPAGNADNMFAPRRGNGADFDCACGGEPCTARACRRARSAVQWCTRVALALARARARSSCSLWRPGSRRVPTARRVARAGS